jgi:hypothetical protein
VFEYVWSLPSGVYGAKVGFVIAKLHAVCVPLPEYAGHSLL